LEKTDYRFIGPCSDPVYYSKIFEQTLFRSISISVSCFEDLEKEHTRHTPHGQEIRSCQGIRLFTKPPNVNPQHSQFILFMHMIAFFEFEPNQVSYYSFILLLASGMIVSLSGSFPIKMNL
jgi:hypothetical protein